MSVWLARLGLVALGAAVLVPMCLVRVYAAGVPGGGRDVLLIELAGWTLLIFAGIVGGVGAMVLIGAAFVWLWGRAR